jgi:hypothetical protein
VPARHEPAGPAGSPGAPAARARKAGTLVIACGALARELVELTRRPGFETLELTCLPAHLHNRPEKIPAAVARRIRAARPFYERIFVAYADCGTGGLLDRVLEAEGVERLAGAHCYEFFAGRADFARLMDDDPATFFLTDFLTRNFDRLIIRGLGLDRHPELLPTYFGNYHRLVYLAQGDDPALFEAARRAADWLGLTFEHRRTGFGDLATAITSLATLSSADRAPGHPGAFARGQSSADGARPTLSATPTTPVAL